MPCSKARKGLPSSGTTWPKATATARLFRDGGFTHVIHLAAQPGVRHSLTHPEAYVRNNLTAFGHVLEGCRHARVAHLVYASSSSVYGASHTLPFSEDQRVDQPVSLYAATKCANELMAHSYAHLFAMPVTGLRFFTVYGPWGRPDQAPMLFTKAILAGQPIKVFNEGRMQRDFTYIDDIVEGVVRVLALPPAPGPAGAPAAIYNIGNQEAVCSPTSLRRSRRCWAGSRCATSSRCSRATCPPPMPPSRTCGPRPDLRRARRWRRGSPVSRRGIATSTGSDRPGA